MFLDHSACVISLLNLYLMAYISPMFGSLQALPDDACIFSITLRNFRPVLSWEFKNHSIVPTHYTLWYTYMSRSEDMKIAEDCANITRSFCDLTSIWETMSDTYIFNVVGVQGNTTQVNCMVSVFPDTQMSLEPPKFDIVDVMDHINVTLRFPPTMPKMPNGEEIWLYLSLLIEVESEGVVKKHTLKINEDTSGNFTYVIKELIPNTNYCVSVYFEPRDMETIKRSPWKCTRLPPIQEPGYNSGTARWKRHMGQGLGEGLGASVPSSEPSESARIGGLIILFLIVAVSISTIATLKRIGYICLRPKFPKVLKFNNLSAWVFPELPPLEAVAVLEVIAIHRKKKVWDYTYDESDSDNEAVPRPSAGGYTMHGLCLCNPQASASNLSDTSGERSDPDTQEAMLVEAEAKPENESQSLVAPGPGPWQSEYTSRVHDQRGTQLAAPSSREDSSSTEGSGDRIFFNVNLNSVFVRVLDDDDDDDDNSEAPPVFSLPEESVGLEDLDVTETSLLVASGGTQPSFSGPSVECLWPEDALSDKSDTSESDIDIRDGYIMR
ncbi:interferon alpha/beta receptor 2 isoform X1 [Saccopteryx leptura]|uniref:interferon alpha/beta receptor 2 isoform X1 n=2 Tax=Saccopteryx leptura TaxID=249018 RepID=UPI00339BC2CA